jgi:hypothetical protein
LPPLIRASLGLRWRTTSYAYGVLVFLLEAQLCANRPYSFERI